MTTAGQRSGLSPLAVVTGGSGGIGQEIVTRLVATGYDVVVLSRTAPSLPGQPAWRHVTCDLTDSTVVLAAAADLLSEGRRIDVLIHCAGVIVPSAVRDLVPQDVERQIAINLTAPALLTSRLLPMMGQGGHVVFINSLAAVMPLAGSSIYAASKAALRSFALSLAQELQPRGIAVSSVFPGAVDTAMLRNEMAQGGSVLNFVNPPARPEAIADTVIKILRRRGGEHFRPVIDGMFGRLCMFTPGLLRLSLPILTYFGRCGAARNQKRNGTR